MWCQGQGCKVGYRCENIVRRNYNNEFSSGLKFNLPEPVVQNTIESRPWLNFDPLFWLMHFWSTVRFKT